MLFLVAGCWLWAPPARAQLVIHGKRVVSVRALPPSLVPDPGEICIYRTTGRTSGTFVRAHPLVKAPALRARQEASATILIDYDSDFPEAAREALRRAADIWEQHLRSSVPIRIRATYSDTLGENTLATAGTTLLFSFEFSDGSQSPAYPSALADAISGRERNTNDPDAADITMSFNSERDDWYFGTGEPGPNQIDFASVALHEITHGLGFYGSMSVTDGVGRWGFDFEGINSPVPAVYDVSRVDEGEGEVAMMSATENAQGRRLTNPSVYPNASEALAGALTGRVFFDGPQARAGYAADPDAQGRDPRPELFAPEPWEEGSSYAHLDEDIYPEGAVNSLMSPQIGAQEVVQSPGGIVCGMFADMGWPLGTGCRALLSDLIAFEPAPVPEEDAVDLTWVLAADTEVEQVEIQRCDGGREQCNDEGFQPIATVVVSGAGACQIGSEDQISCQHRVSVTEPGLYTFRLVLVEADGTRTPGLQREAFIAPEQLLVHVYPNPFRERATLRVVFAGEAPRRLTVDLYDALGRRLWRRVLSEVRQEERIEIASENMAGGIYFIRVRGEDFSESRPIVLVR